MTNTFFPGRPDYTGPVTGLFGLLHHDILTESSHDVLERISYVKKHKSRHEVGIRLHNMIYLGSCPAASTRNSLDADYQAKRVSLYADYLTKHSSLDAGYWAKRASLDAEILAYIKTHIPDCAWNGHELVFG